MVSKIQNVLVSWMPFEILSPISATSPLIRSSFFGTVQEINFWGFLILKTLIFGIKSKSLSGKGKRLDCKAPDSDLQKS